MAESTTGRGIRSVAVKEHPAAVAWMRFAGASSPPETIEALEEPSNGKPRHRPVFRLSGPAIDNSTIIAKRCPRFQAERELFIYQEILPQLPLTSPEAFGFISEGTGKNNAWFFMEEVIGAPYEPSLPRHRELAGRWLGTLHTSSLELEKTSGLVDQGPGHFLEYLHKIRAILEAVAENPALQPADRRDLGSLDRQCAALLDVWAGIEDYCSTFPATLVRGDFKEPHILVQESAKEQLVLLDWADAGWGPPAVDLAKFIGYSVDPDLDAYLSVARRRWPEFHSATVRRLGYVGEVFRWIATVRWHAEALQYEWVERPMSQMRVYLEWMEEILEVAPWRNSRFFADLWRPAVRSWY